MDNNTNIGAGNCICSFSYGTTRIFIFEMPDENEGFISGWLFVYNCCPYFYSIAQGSEGLNMYVANMYAQYLSECGDSTAMDVIEGNEEDGYELNSDTFIDFNQAFEDAMRDANFVEEMYKGEWTGRWVRKPKKSRAAKKNKTLAT